MKTCLSSGRCRALAGSLNGVRAKVAAVPAQNPGESGRQVAAVRVERRGTVKLFVPVESGKSNELCSHAGVGGRPAKNDARTLHFRVFEIGVDPAQRMQ
jgi:hypothetical protein